MNCLSHEVDLTLTVVHSGFENFEDLNSTIKLLSPGKPSYARRLTMKFSKKVKKRNSEYIKRFLNRHPQDFILLNTLLVVNNIDFSVLTGTRTILYVHETEEMLMTIDKEKLNLILNKIDLILCSSKAVKNYFEILGRANQIENLYPAVDFNKFSVPVSRRNLRKHLGFDEDNFILMMSGALLLNKNPKAFISAAKEINKENSKVRFLWIGATGSSAYEVFLKNYIKKNNLEKVVKIIPRQTADYYEYLNTANGFLLTSLSESFSLAALEAASFGKPVISFPCGGVLESVPKTIRKVTFDFSILELTSLIREETNSEIQNLGTLEIENLLEKHQVKIASEFRGILEKFFPSYKK